VRTATSHGQPPSPELESRLAELIEAMDRGEEQTQTVTHTRGSDPAPDGRAQYLDGGLYRYRPHLLRVLVDDCYEVIGVAVLAATGHALRPLSQGFLDAIARTLCESARSETLRPPQTH
jgi:hypothetical protein